MFETHKNRNGRTGFKALFCMPYIAIIIKFSSSHLLYQDVNHQLWLFQDAGCGAEGFFFFFFFATLG